MFCYSHFILFQYDFPCLTFLCMALSDKINQKAMEFVYYISFSKYLHTHVFSKFDMKIDVVVSDYVKLYSACNFTQKTNGRGFHNFNLFYMVFHTPQHEKFIWDSVLIKCNYNFLPFVSIIMYIHQVFIKYG